MAYIALYRKWRPKTFEDVVGQRQITETLQKAIDTDKVAHAYLFSGPRGTGKTSTAKIFARAMNCVHGPTSKPCNTCEICRHIMSGESLDVVEIDAASNRSIDDIRNLRETIKFMPAEGRKKIYIIDEVHMLTTEAFNALLKTLEEPPAHVIFILATTEPEKIPMTILSRCQRYEFRRITSQDIADRILYVAEQEQIPITKGAAHILAVQADGGMRDALSLLDQCVSNAEGTIDEALVRDLLGLVGRDWLFSLAKAVFQGKGDVIIKDVDDVVRMGREPRVILTELLEHLRAIMLYQAAPQSDTLAAYADSLDELGAQAKSVSPQQVFRILGTLQQALLTAKNSPVPRVAVEMGLLMASAGETTPELAKAVPAAADGALIQRLADRVSRLEQALAGGVKAAAPAPQKTAEEIPLPDDEFAASAPPPDDFDDAGFLTSRPAVPVEPVPGESAPAPAGRTPQRAARQPQPAPKVPKKPAAAPEKPAAAASSQSAAAPAQYAAIWKQVCQILEKQKKFMIVSCIKSGKVVYIGDTEVIISLNSPFLVKRANLEDYYTFIDAALVSILGKGYHMRAYLDKDPELARYEKKNAEPLTRPEAAAALPLEEKEPAQEPVPETAPAAQEKPVLTPVRLDDVPASERRFLEPLLKTLGDCHIYIENKE